MKTTLLLDGRLPSVAGATALAIAAGTVIWAGDDSTGRACFSDADEVWELHGALVTPAFVDAHVHATSAGLLTGGPGWTAEEPLTGEAHHHARRTARESITPSQRREAQQAFLVAAAARGV